MSRRHVDSLRRLDAFRDLAEADVQRFAARFVEEAKPAREVVFQHGDAAEYFYMVVEGEVSIYRDEVGRPMQLRRRVEAGESFGEAGMFNDQTRTSSARTRQACRLLKIAREDLLSLLEEYPSVALKLQLASARRHSQNVAAVLEMGMRRDLRIRLDQEVELDLGGQDQRKVVLANLSQGGLCLANAPAAWMVGSIQELTLRYDDEVLVARARVCWQQDVLAGLAFVDGDADLEYRIQRFLRLLLE